MNILVAHLFSVPCNASLPFPLKDSEFNMPPKRPQTNAGRAAARPASSGKGARNGSHPVTSGSGASQPASSAGSCSQPATVSTTHQAPPEDFDIAWARVSRLGRFPNRIMNPQTEAQQEEADLWVYWYLQKSMGMPDDVWNRLRRYRNPPICKVPGMTAEDAREAVVADVEAFVKEFRRLPKHSWFYSGSEEDKLSWRLLNHKKRFDDAQQVRYIALQVQCDTADVVWNRLRRYRNTQSVTYWNTLHREQMTAEDFRAAVIADVEAFVNKFRRLPKRSRDEGSGEDKLRKRRQRATTRGYIKRYFKQVREKAELLSERLAKTTKEFEEAHLTELRNLQKDAEQKAVEDLVQEVTELGYWLHSQFNKVSTADLDYRPSNRVCRA